MSAYRWRENEIDNQLMLELASDNGSVHSQTVMEWFALPVSGTATREELDRRLNAERDSGDK